MFQLFQDVELIKKVVFEQRHLVLAPFVTLECEKKAIEQKNKEPGDKDAINYVQNYKDENCDQINENKERFKTNTEHENKNLKINKQNLQELNNSSPRNLAEMKIQNISQDDKINNLIDVVLEERAKRVALEKKVLELKNRVEKT